MVRFKRRTRRTGKSIITSDMGCSFCHESSTREGLHGNLQDLCYILEDLPAGVELALGGGNPLAHPELIDFLDYCKHKGFIPNITVNQGHLKRYQGLLTELIESKLVYGVGISINGNNWTYVNHFKQISDNIVFHVIAGVHPLEIMDKLITYKSPKILVLGYKTWGFGIDYEAIRSKETDANIYRWMINIHRYFDKGIISFDNLALEQLKVKRLFTDEKWQEIYMGDDFQFTMYIDAVKQEFSPTSRSKERVSFKETSLLEYFQK